LFQKKYEYCRLSLKKKMKFLALQPFVPSGLDFESSKSFFKDLGFEISWDGGDYVGYVKDDCRFILQRFDNRTFAENFMITVRLEDADRFWEELTEKKITEKYKVSMTSPADQPYGREVNVIDIAGVCWHFVSELPLTTSS
jgi:hypothetical protein